MADVLTQAQIDEMLKNVAAGAVPEVTQKEEEKVKEYDFRAPKKFTKEQIKVLDGIFENYARLLSSYLTGLLRLYCRVSLVNIEEQRCSEFNNALPDYVLMGMVDMGIKNEEVSETNVIIQISNTITFTMIDRLLGGRGEYRDVNRDFTEIEITIMNDVMNSMANLLYEPWASHIDLEPKLIGIETNSRVVQTIGHEDTVIIVALEVEINGSKSIISVCIPAINLDEIMNKFISRYNGNNGSVFNANAIFISQYFIIQESSGQTGSILQSINKHALLITLHVDNTVTTIHTHIRGFNGSIDISTNTTTPNHIIALLQR